MESLLLDECWDPLVCLIGLNDIFFVICDFDKPRVSSSVDQRSLRSPAEGIAMVDGSLCEKSAFVLDALSDV